MSTGWDTSSGASKLPVHVTGTDLDGNDVDEVAYVDSAGDGISLVQGDYTLSVAASPLGSGGGTSGASRRGRFRSRSVTRSARTSRSM